MPALIEITGFADLQRKLRDLGDDRKKRSAMLAVLRAASQPTVRAARSRVPVARKPHKISGKRTAKTIQPGNLKKSIGNITGRRGRSRIDPTIYVGGRAKGNNDGFYAGWVEHGHEIHNQGITARVAKRRGIASGGRTRPQPFMSPAFEQTQGQVTQDTVKRVEKVIQAQINRLSTP
jgi:HK97 gp10 family phage protein